MVVFIVAAAAPVEAGGATLSSGHVARSSPLVQLAASTSAGHVACSSPLVQLAASTTVLVEGYIRTLRRTARVRAGIYFSSGGAAPLTVVVVPPVSRGRWVVDTTRVVSVLDIVPGVADVKWGKACPKKKKGKTTTQEPPPNIGRDP